MKRIPEATEVKNVTGRVRCDNCLDAGFMLHGRRPVGEALEIRSGVVVAKERRHPLPPGYEEYAPCPYCERGRLIEFQPMRPKIEAAAVKPPWSTDDGFWQGRSEPPEPDGWSCITCRDTGYAAFDNEHVACPNCAQGLEVAEGGVVGYAPSERAQPLYGTGLEFRPLPAAENARRMVKLMASMSRIGRPMPGPTDYDLIHEALADLPRAMPSSDEAPEPRTEGEEIRTDGSAAGDGADHSVEIVENFMEDGCRAVCACGWQSAELQTAKEAHVAGLEHYGKPTTTAVEELGL